MEPSFLIAKLITFILSLVVAYIAYHGYRRSDQKPMLYVSGGFVFIGVGAICEGIIYHIFDTTIASAALIQAIVVSSGMTLILMSLRK
ncbi:hypothetical protein [Natrinema hispanicum]|uniref:Uncharacterized protein n=1 Tax=Natrinema hispanicum TaxID=392421 RepID=A0A1G6YZF3_9EURY|nr:hypothetical protein [Natrinema hispanicum]SDD95027.1 hypothetical protein SAMN05192552_10782 [Natrinema hispanicum]SEU07937.1 hypothetical protein SAMN04488694_13824 [Natrinema hispanicum]